MRNAFAALAKNPALGEPPPIREPGSFGPYDQSESHLFKGPMDKGVMEGLSHGFGLRSPSEGIVDALADTWENLKSGAADTFQKIADYKAPPGTKTAFNAEGILSGRVPAALLLTLPSMTASGIEGMAGLLEQGTKQIKDSWSGSNGTLDRQKFGQGVGMILSSLAQIASGLEGSSAAEKAAGKAGGTMEARAPRPGNAILRATDPRNYLYGKTPGRAFIDEPIHITNSISNVAEQLSQAGDRLYDAVERNLNRPQTAKITMNVKAPLDQIFRDALDDVSKQAGMRNRGGVITAIKTLEDDVMNEHDADGNVVRARPFGMKPAEINELKRSVGKSTKWDAIPGAVDPEISAFVNDVRKKVYGTLNDLMEQAAPGTKALNARYANVIEASRLIAKRMAQEESADLGMRRLLSRGEWLGSLAAFMHGEPVTGTALAVHNAGRSTAGRIARSQVMDTAGRALQTPAARTAAGAAGTAAGSIPAVSGAARRTLAGEEAQP